MSDISLQETERLIIGSLLIDIGSFWNPTISETLKPEHFVTQLHGRIFSVLADMAHENRKPALSIIAPKVAENEGQEEGILAELGAMVRDAKSFDGPVFDFVPTLVEEYGRRRIAAIARSLNKKARDKEANISDIVAAAEAELADVMAVGQHEPDRSLAEIYQRVLDEAAKAYADQNYRIAYDTGLNGLDDILGPIRPGRLYFVGGSEKSGKTALVTQIGERIAEAGNGVVFMAQGEMTMEEMGVRSLANASGVGSSTIESGAFNTAEFVALTDAAARLSQRAAAKFRIWTPSRMRLSDLRHRAMSISRRHGLAALIVDHLLHVDPDKEYENQFRGIADVIRGLKRLAVQLNIPVFVLVHRTRGSQDRNDPMPFATDHFGGGEIERACDALISIFSREAWLKLRKPKNDKEIEKWELALAAAEGKRQIALLSHRHAPFPRVRDFHFNGALTRFEDL